MKERAYQQASKAIASLIEGETDAIAVMSTVACELFHSFDYINWAGFYRRTDDQTLKVGPYQGSHGCLTIDVSRGVCGACVREGAVQIENDVHEATDHIACSAETQAEIVLPIQDATGRVVAVLDIDSVQRDVFDDVDVRALSEICEWVGEVLRVHGEMERK